MNYSVRSATRPPRDGLSRRLAPLYLASVISGLALWVPIEKLFMTEIGFTSASVGLMAAVYAVVVPVLELPSGVLADRWSRRGVLVLGTIAAIMSVLIGGLSQNVTVYVIAAAFLGVYFALQSGTLESIASGVGTLTWLAFVPFALIFGVTAETVGVDQGALLFVAVGAAAALLMLVVLPRVRIAVVGAAEPSRGARDGDPSGVSFGPILSAR